MNEEPKKKLYSPDIQEYSFEGVNFLTGTFSYIIVAPIRLVMRVMHNIFVMPANIQDEFAEGLLVTAAATFALGVIDLIVRHRWCMMVSQIPLFPIAISLRKRALQSEQRVTEKPIVDIDSGQVEKLVTTVYDELDEVIK